MNKIIFNLPTSCSKDEAIALLIGLGDQRYVPMESHYNLPDGIDVETELTFCLSEYLSEEYDFLECDYNLAKHNKEPKEETATALDKLHKFKELISKAENYACYFDDEIAKGETSAIRIHQLDSTFTPRYTVVSIYEWIKTLKFQDCNLNSFLKKNSESSEIPKNEDQSNQENWSSNTTAETFHTTFAFMVEAFALTNNDYNKDGRPIIHAIAKHLEKCATSANIGHILLGQQHENIRKMISKSFKNKERVLRKRGDLE